MNGLLLESNAKAATRDELKFIPTPGRTRTWRPVPHFDAASLVVAEAGRNGYDIETEEYGLTPSGSKMFGVLRIHPHGHPEFSRAIGIRNAHDKSLAFGITAGVSVLVCSNLCFGGETTIHRKHTSGIDLKSLIPDAFGSLAIQYEKLEGRIGEMHEEAVTARMARLSIVWAAEHNIIPSCDVVPTLRTYEKPPHDDFLPRTKWSLYNAFTEVCKKSTPVRADRTYRGLARMFHLN